MTTLSPTLIAARYPLCLEDDTLMCDDELIRHIRNKCGDTVGDAIAELIYSNSFRAKAAEIASDIDAEASSVSDHLYELKEYLDELRKLVNME